MTARRARAARGVPTPDDTARALQQRVDELEARAAVVNEVSEALGKQLDFAAITELVGERIHSIFPGIDMFVALYEPEAGLISFPYEIADDRRYHSDPIPFGEGLTSEVIRTRRPLLLRTMEEATNHGAVWVGPISASWVGVPIISGERVLGVIALESLEPYAFGDDDERLLSTLAASTSAALDNARLFDETKRLLAEADERAAELSVVSSVQQGLAAKLETQAMYDLVGDRLRDVFDAQVVDIGIFDHDEGLFHFPYTIERGVRFPDEGLPLIGFRRHVMETKQSLLINEHASEQAVAYGQPAVLQGEPTKSSLFAPLVVSGEATGVISLQNLDREFAFNDADVRLLTTLAASLSVALENVRLFDETKRLLAETEQRNAELAVVNEIGSALGNQLEFNAIIDAVGDRVGQILGSGEISIAMLDPETNLITFPYWIDDGIRDRTIAPMPLGKGLNPHVIQTGQSLRLGRAEEAEALGARFIGVRTELWLGAPIRAGDRVLGVISVSDRAPDSFTEADERLLTTVSASMGVALENARLFDETKRLLAETEQRSTELAVINEIGAALAQQLDFAAIIELIGNRLATMFRSTDMYVGMYDRITKHDHVSLRA